MLAGLVLETDLRTGASDVVLDVSALVSTGAERGLLGMAPVEFAEGQR